MKFFRVLYEIVTFKKIRIVAGTRHNSQFYTSNEYTGRNKHIMKAIILAAGIGNRLGEASADKPKSLLEFEGKSLLKRHIDILIENQIEELMIVTGFQSEMIETHLKDSALPIQYIYNERYTEGSIISLYCALEIHFTEPEFILMDADVLYGPEMIKRLVHTEIENCLLLDRDFIPGDEPVKICVDKNGRINEFRKKVAADLDYDIQGESVGFFKFNKLIGSSLLGRINDYLSKGENDTPYEEAIRDLIKIYPEQFGYEDITGIPWIEIDFPEDIERAKNEILPNI